MPMIKKQLIKKQLIKTKLAQWICYHYHYLTPRVKDLLSKKNIYGAIVCMFLFNLGMIGRLIDAAGWAKAPAPHSAVSKAVIASGNDFWSVIVVPSYAAWYLIIACLVLAYGILYAKARFVSIGLNMSVWWWWFAAATLVIHLGFLVAGLYASCAVIACWISIVSHSEAKVARDRAAEVEETAKAIGLVHELYLTGDIDKMRMHVPSQS